MAKLVMYGVRAPVAFAQNTTRYLSLGSEGCYIQATTTTSVQRTNRAPGVFSNLIIRVTANSINVTPSTTVTFQIGGVDKTQVITVPASGSGGVAGEYEDTTHSDASSAGDIINAKAVFGASGANTLSIAGAGVSFAATTNTVITHGVNQGSGTATASTLDFAALTGRLTWTTTEATVAYRVRAAGTLQNLCINVITAARSTTTTLGVRYNGTNSALTIAVPTGSALGIYEDTSNSRAVSAGDLVCFSRLTGTGTGDFTVNFFVDHVTTDGTTDYITSEGFTALAASATVYGGVQGGLVNGATQSFTQTKAGIIGVASLNQAYASANTIVAASTLTFQIDGANVTGSISIPGVATFVAGWYEDTSHSDAFSVTSQLGRKSVLGAAGTSLTLVYVAAKITITEHATATPSGVTVASGVNAAVGSGAGNAAPSGVSAASTVNAPTGSGGANAAPTGVSASAGINAPTGSGAGNAAPTGVGVGSGVGTPGGAGAGDAPVTGVTADTDVGQPTATGGAVAAPSGVGVTSDVHAPTASAPDGTATPAGVSVTTSVGQATASGNAPPPTPGYTGGGTPPGPKYQRPLHRPRNPFTHITVTPETDREYDVIRDGTARPHGVGVRVSVGRAMAATESFARPVGVAVHVGVGVPQTSGDACASPDGVEVGVSVAYLEPWGVENPSDAELMDWTLGLIDA